MNKFEVVTDRSLPQFNESMLKTKRASLDYRELYKNKVGACVSCAHIRTLKLAEGKEFGILDDENYIEYDGGKYAVCILPEHCGWKIVIRDKPDLALPANDCWNAKPVTESNK